jgi:5-deoxy-glucuronate isomerase
VRYVIRAGDGGRDGFDLVVGPPDLRYAGLRVVTVPAGGEVALPTEDVETIVLPLQGSAMVRAADAEHVLQGRADVFTAATDVVYVPSMPATLHSATGGRFALCTAPATGGATRPSSYLEAAQVPVERRGAGTMSRLVRNFGTVDGIGADSLIACEVITPGGNWSSYPAHKHDETAEHESELEEIYYYEIATGPSGEPGVAFHRTSSSPGHEIDVTVEVHDRDVALVPFGWHGPVTPAPGHDLYQLNVMAGPAPGRRWLISDHPEQTWVRDTWPDLPVDPRLLDGRYGA